MKCQRFKVSERHSFYFDPLTLCYFDAFCRIGDKKHKTVANVTEKLSPMRLISELWKDKLLSKKGAMG